MKPLIPPLEDLEACFRLQIDRFRELCESPIEALFFDAVVSMVAVTPASSGFWIACDLMCVPQERIAGYRADFAFYAYSPGLETQTLRFVVELDGHDFHERTKEQASRDKARDRALQGEGYAVLRFSGSDVHRDPRETVRDVFRFLIARHRESQPEIQEQSA